MGELVASKETGPDQCVDFCRGCAVAMDVEVNWKLGEKRGAAFGKS